MSLELLKAYNILGNTAYDYFIALGVLVLSLLVLKVFQSYILARLKKTAKKSETNLDNVMVNVVDNISSFFYFVVSFYIGFQFLDISRLINRIADVVFIFFVAKEGISALSKLVEFSSRTYLKRTQEEEEGIDTKHASSIIRLFRIALVVVLWVMVVLFILSNFGINVASMIAGLGIGGIAIGLALQNVLSDVFSSVSIFLDQPFKVGDLIQVGEDVGTVEKIGIKSTRLRTLKGQQLIISNQELTSARIQNYRKMEKRRADVNIGVAYDTPQEKLEQIPDMIEEIINSMDNIDFRLCRLSKFGDSALIFELMYYVNEKEYESFMDAKQELNLAIFDKFKEEGIELPFPTRTVYLEK